MNYVNYVFRKYGYAAMQQFKVAEKAGLPTHDCLMWAKECRRDRRKVARK